MDLSERLLRERRARLAAERLLELKSRELFAANRKLADHARALTDQVVAQRRVAESAQSVAEELQGENLRVRSDLVRATQAQTVAERRLWQALGTMRDGFAIYDAEQRLVVANEAYLQPFEGLDEIGPGILYADLLRIGLEEGVFDTHGMADSEWLAWMLDRWAVPKIEPSVIRLWSGRYVRLDDRRGEDGGIVSLAHDITEATLREDALREARSRAEAASRAKSAFLANMSHELRTPMNGVVGMIELLCETTLSDEQRLYAETIKSSGEALLQIINDVLDFSKLDADKMQLHPEPFDLERVIHEILVMLSPPAHEKGLALGLDYDLFLPTEVVGDRGRIRQILTNLIGNAVKFTPAGRVLVRVVGIDRGEGLYRMTVAVEDTGIGVAPEMRDHIFGEFNQVEGERNRKFEGTGLGLAISRRLVRLMGGEMWLESTPGEGSVFAFSLDLPAAGPVPAVARAIPSGLQSALVIDKDATSRAILIRQLGSLGVNVTAAAHGGGAEVPPDCGVLFCDAPEEVRALLPQLPADGTQRPRVILLAASPADAAAPLPPAIDQAIVKPVQRAALFEALGAAGAASPPVPLPAPPEVVPEPPAPARRLRVLAAEDNRTNQLIFTRMLKDQPLEIRMVGNGREAVEAFSEEVPDLVFMDISMPEIDGREAARMIRAIEAERGLPRTPIVALTAHAMEGDAEDILAAGLDRHIQKPLKKAAVLQAIADFCPAQGGAPQAAAG